MQSFEILSVQRSAIAAFFAFLLSGCDQISNFQMTSEEKIALAFPLPAQISFAESQLSITIAGNKIESTKLKSRLSHLKSLRAMSCVGVSSVGRFETVTQLQLKPKDLECFKKHDFEITEFIGGEHVAVLSKLPALRPFVELPNNTVLPFADTVVEFLAADSANLAVVANPKGMLTVLDLTSAKPISSFQSPSDYFRSGTFSPNGRLLAVRASNRKVNFYDVEAGSLVWSTDLFSQVISWLPQSNGLIVVGGNDMKNSVLNFGSGKLEPYLPDQRRLTWSLNVPKAETQRLVGNEKSVLLVEHAIESDSKVTTKVIKQWKLEGTDASAHLPMLFGKGKYIVFKSIVGLAWVNLETNEQGTWSTSIWNPRHITKLNDSQLIMLDAKFTNDVNRQAKIIDVERQEILSLAVPKVTDGRWMSLYPRSGLISYVNNAFVVSRDIETINPLPLEKELAMATIEKQLAKLQIEPGENNLFGSASSSKLPFAAHSSHESIESGHAYRTLNPSHASQLAAVKPLLTDIPKNANVSVIGVYEPKVGSRQGGAVTVNIQPAEAPLVLVLSSYEAVRWNVLNPSGRKIAAILLSGYNESTIVGGSRQRTLRIGSTSVYKLNSPDYEQLKLDVARYVPNTIKSFQGAYAGSEFSVSE
jgi:hypothetical protein